MMDSEERRIIRPQGLAAILLGATIGLSVASLVVVALRTWQRVRMAIFSAEDYLMIGGLVLFLGQNSVIVYGTFTGIGSPDSKLNTAMQIEAAKAVFVWQLIAGACFLLIKGSICATFIRIASRRRVIYILYLLIGLAAISTVVSIIAVLVRCKPVSASWDPSAGTCLSRSIFAALLYLVSAINIINDFAFAITPVYLLWNVRMEPRVKATTVIILGLGFLASTATIVRIPYVAAYNSQSDLLEKIGHIVLWTVVECSLGIIAGSLPMLRQLFKRLLRERSTKDDAYNLRERSGTMRLGNASSKTAHKAPINQGNDSTHQIIRTTRIDVEVDSVRSSDGRQEIA